MSSTCIIADTLQRYALGAGLTHSAVIGRCEMEFTIPKKGDNPVCLECANNFPQVYNCCFHPCGQLVLWAMQREVVKDTNVQ
jgi:hypothetical protein